jgi:CheY-like chemotaxis protein
MPAKLGRSLGPYIVQKRVEALGGECGVSNRADGLNGTLYWFTFPYKPAASSSTVITSHNTTSANGTASQTVSTLNAVKEGGGDDVDDHAAKRRRFTAQLNILLVDDSMTTLKVVRRTLMEQGHYVQTAKDGKQGLDSMLEAIQAVCMARSRDVSQLLSECSDEDLDEELKRLGSQKLLMKEDEDALLSLDPGRTRPQSQPQHQPQLNFDITSAKRSVTVLPPIGGSSTNNSPMKSGNIQQQVPSAAATTDSADRYLLRGRRVSTVPMMLPPENLSALSRMSSSSTRSSISMSCFDVVLMDLEMPIMSKSFFGFSVTLHSILS